MSKLNYTGRRFLARKRAQFYQGVAIGVPLLEYKEDGELYVTNPSGQSRRLFSPNSRHGAWYTASDGIELSFNKYYEQIKM